MTVVVHDNSLTADDLHFSVYDALDNLPMEDAESDNEPDGGDTVFGESGGVGGSGSSHSLATGAVMAGEMAGGMAPGRSSTAEKEVVGSVGTTTTTTTARLPLSQQGSGGGEKLVGGASLGSSSGVGSVAAANPPASSPATTGMAGNSSSTTSPGDNNDRQLETELAQTAAATQGTSSSVAPSNNNVTNPRQGAGSGTSRPQQSANTASPPRPLLPSDVPGGGSRLFLRPTWRRDEEAHVCTRCLAPFTLVRCVCGGGSRARACVRVRVCASLRVGDGV